MERNTSSSRTVAALIERLIFYSFLFLYFSRSQVAHSFLARNQVVIAKVSLDLVVKQITEI